MGHFEHGLGRRRSPEDRRDYLMAARLATVKEEAVPTSRFWPWGPTFLNQGDTPRCVGYACANWMQNAPVRTRVTNATGDLVYAAAKKLDGDNLPGSTVRSGIRALTKMGRVESYHWARTVDDVRLWLLTSGPVIVGTEWYEAMYTPDRGLIVPQGPRAGGHCYLAFGADAGFIWVLNSWGHSWGVGGGARMTWKDFARLLEADGEACAAVEKPLAA